MGIWRERIGRAVLKGGITTTTATTIEEDVCQPQEIVGGTLKKYQLVGLKWLIERHDRFMPGILGDEMVPLVSNLSSGRSSD